MGDTFASAIESALAEGQHNAMLTRYFAIAGLSLMLWDYCLTIDQEVDLIWRAKNISLSRVVFRLSRYGLIFSLLYANTVLTFLPKRMMSQEICKSFASILAFCVMMSALGTNSYLIMRHLRAWDGRREIYWVIICSMGLTHIPGVVLAGISMKEMYRSTVYVAFLDTCAIFSKSPAVIPAWACVITFDSIVIVLSLLNNLDRPRRRDADIIVYLKRDGAPFFLTVFALRYIGLVLLVQLPAAQYFLTIFLAWPMTSITLCRFILSSERAAVSLQTSLLVSFPSGAGDLVDSGDMGYELSRLEHP